MCYKSPVFCYQFANMLAYLFKIAVVLFSIIELYRHLPQGVINLDPRSQSWTFLSDNKFVEVIEKIHSIQLASSRVR